MIYLTFAPDLLDLNVPEDYSPDNILEVDRRLECIARHLAIVGALTHSDLLEKHKFILLLNNSTLDDLNDKLAMLTTHVSILRDRVNEIYERMSKVFQNMRTVDQFYSDIAHQISVSDVPWLTDDFKYLTLGCLCVALQQCSDLKGAAASILIVTNTGFGEIEVQLKNQDQIKVRYGNTPLCLDPNPIEDQRHGLVFQIPTEDHQSWSMRPISRKKYIQWMDRAPFSTATSGGKGGHIMYSITFKYLPWLLRFWDERERHEWPAQLKSMLNAGNAVIIPPELQIKTPGKSREIGITIATSRNDFPASFANEKAREIGLNPRRTWWLLMGEQDGECANTLADVLAAK